MSVYFSGPWMKTNLVGRDIASRSRPVTTFSTIFKGTPPARQAADPRSTLLYVRDVGDLSTDAQSLSSGLKD